MFLSLHLLLAIILLATLAKPYFTSGRIHWRLQLWQLCNAILLWLAVVVTCFQIVTSVATRYLDPEDLERFLHERAWLQQTAFQGALVIWAIKWQEHW
jgi:hypothetical protein